MIYSSLGATSAVSATTMEFHALMAASHQLRQKILLDVADYCVRQSRWAMTKFEW